MAAIVKLEPQSVDVLTAMPAAGNDVAIKTEEAQQQTSSAQAAPSLISAVTQAAVGNAPGGMQSILEDGHVFMPPLPADLQAELASSASSSFNGVATFGIMQQQLLSTFDGSPVLAGDFAADLFASPGFAVTASTDTVMTDGPGGVAPAAHDAAAAAAAASVAAVKAAVASNIGDTVPVMDPLAFNAAAGVSHCIVLSVVSLPALIFAYAAAASTATAIASWAWHQSWLHTSFMSLFFWEHPQMQCKHAS